MIWKRQTPSLRSKAIWVERRLDRVLPNASDPVETELGPPGMFLPDIPSRLRDLLFFVVKNATDGVELPESCGAGAPPKILRASAPLLEKQKTRRLSIGFYIMECPKKL